MSQDVSAVNCLKQALQEIWNSGEGVMRGSWLQKGDGSLYVSAQAMRSRLFFITG